LSEEWHFMDPDLFVRDDDRRYRADPDYIGGPTDLLHLANGSLGLSGPEYELGREVNAKITTVVQMVLECAASLPGYQRATLVSVNCSGENSLVLENGDNVIIKLTPADKATALEALILRELTLLKRQREEKRERAHKRRPPLEIADFILYKPEATGMFQQVWQTRVGGQKISDERVRDFSNAEKRKLGKGVGAFIAYLADAIPLERYKEILEQAGNPILFDRAYLVQHPANFQRLQSAHTGVGFQKIAHPSSESELYPEVVEIQWSLKERLEKLEGEGRISTPIIGHDDLRPGNLTFERAWHWPKITKRAFKPKAVIDFESIMPTSPERTLRHIAVHGEQAIGPAEEAYGQHLDRELIDFWRDVQLVTVFIAYLYRLPATQQSIEKLIPYLETCLPDTDWRGFVST